LTAENAKLADDAAQLRRELEDLEQQNPVLSTSIATWENSLTASQESEEQQKVRNEQLHTTIDNLEGKLAAISAGDEMARRVAAASEAKEKLETENRELRKAMAAVQSRDAVDVLRRDNQGLHEQLKAREHELQELGEFAVEHRKLKDETASVLQSVREFGGRHPTTDGKER
jgi:chromosome segregation ATPase